MGGKAIGGDLTEVEEGVGVVAVGEGSVTLPWVQVTIHSNSNQEYKAASMVATAIGEGEVGGKEDHLGIEIRDQEIMGGGLLKGGGWANQRCLPKSGS